MDQSHRDPSDAPDAGSLPPPGDPQLAEIPLPLKLRGARYLIAGLLVALIVSVVSSTYLRIEKQLRETLAAQLEAVLEENVHTISSWLDHRAKIAEGAARIPAVIDFLETTKGSTERPPILPTELRASLGTVLLTSSSKRIDFYDGSGALLDSTTGSGPSSGINLTNPEMKFERASTTSIRETGGALDVRSVARVGPRSAPLGYISLSATPERSPLLPRQFRRGQLFTFDSSGSLEGDPAQERHLPPSALLASSTNASAHHGLEDYQIADGTDVLGAWTWVEKHKLGIVAEVPRDKALSSVAHLRRSFLILVVLVGAAVLGFIALGRWTLRVREESLLMTRRLGRLARAIQPLSAALEHDPSAVVLVDAEGSVVYANAASHRVLGVNAPLLGQDVDEVFDNLHAELQEALISGRDSIVAQGAANDDETLLVSSRNLTIDGNPHFLYMLRPVTQQVRRQEVEHWKKLIRVLSHELNNALAPITSLLSSARKVNQMTHQDARLGAIFESIAERTAHLVSFIEGYREVARLPLPDQREVDWNIFLTGLESQKNFKRKGRVPAQPGYFDPSQLERVLVNVINNAHEAGSKAEEIYVEVIEEPGGFRINVLDRGSGMPEPVLKQAMLPFFSTKRTGTGVGLALSREIIEAHGGQLTLANRDGGGLIVSCFLPHPVQPAPHPSRSRVPIAVVSPPQDSESNQHSEDST